MYRIQKKNRRIVWRFLEYWKGELALGKGPVLSKEPIFVFFQT
ncbi:hypothetical protein LEP1GSC199_3411 [Leptospira vanthielii serovar Holland str. Waz Holland = ATCC 700522]|uniref:Uncharacterized protein n=1 Tax=Leptospira vanthielii serovar Holland str. Waz Holland = ATCC 700522 TaxID=1218591 RepID=N1W6U1_9LEPT|nr:hypothetical protein LEP1GSC199_3411 [Leptospira vanthielii serovar Holland str. Waz Holland = ATCC 700522]